MPFKRSYSLLLTAVILSVSGGCCFYRPNSGNQLLSASLLRSQELFAENEQLLMAQTNLQQTLASVDQERQMLAQGLSDTQNQLATANTRIDNLLAERGELKDRYASALTGTVTDSLSIGGAADVPGFRYDPVTGLSKFPDDVLFDLGSAELRPEALPVLKEFAQKANTSTAAGMRILIVGHTDDQNIVRPATAAKHATNWHLSTDRSAQVITELEKLGVAPERMAAMGYSRFQPLEASTSEPSRQRNRRVELYIVPEATNLAAWDPVRSLN